MTPSRCRGWIEGRRLDELPSPLIRAVQLADAIDGTRDQPLCARELSNRTLIPDDLRPPHKLQDAPAHEIEEEQPHLGMRRDITERVEHHVARVVRPAERA